MSLGIIQKPIYLNIKQGKIYQGEVPYDYVQGRLKSIEMRDRDFRGEVVKYCYINLDSPTGELYSIALPYYSGVAVGVLNSLGSLSDVTQEIKIQPYLYGEYTRTAIYSQGEKLNWVYKELPPVEQVTVGDKTVKDSSKRMSLIEGIVNEINQRLG